MPNLFVSDGSVCITGATADPTRRIVALVIRQADQPVDQTSLQVI